MRLHCVDMANHPSCRWIRSIVYNCCLSLVGFVSAFVREIVYFALLSVLSAKMTPSGHLFSFEPLKVIGSDMLKLIGSIFEAGRRVDCILICAITGISCVMLARVRQLSLVRMFRVLVAISIVVPAAVTYTTPAVCSQAMQFCQPPYFSLCTSVTNYCSTSPTSPVAAGTDIAVLPSTPAFFNGTVNNGTGEALVATAVNGWNYLKSFIPNVNAEKEL